MKKKNIHLITGMIFFISFTMFSEFYSPIILEEDLVVNEECDRDEEILMEPKSSSGHWSNFSFIHITASNWSTAASYDWCSGNGSWENPYVLENITINNMNM